MEAGSAPTLLVVEDDSALARLAYKALSQTRAKVIVHERGFGVLQLVATHRPALLLLDVMMPGLDGPSLVELIRQDPELSHTRVVLWSAVPPEELEAKVRECGADGGIEKVAGPRELVRQISAWLLDWDGVSI